MNISVTSQKSTSISKEKAAALVALLLGSGFIFLIGFSHIEAVHNAAHDTRHSFAFPCH